ncbi:AAA family ATPase [Roseibium sp. Sym1]|uniref:AAA family ATPase n=1 Tax=Roseibium sp. Sym1 TaxID=3016006 RepID=UPI0022B31712|nr:AAA family ATPase [Roseibium sp. Sym1]
MLIVLNGYPGVGKLTIGQVLAPLIGAKLLDIHSVYNIAFALTDFKSDAFYETIRSVQAIADHRICELPPGVPVVLTEILTEGAAWSEECLQRLLDLGSRRGPILMVHLHCDLEENKRRIMGQSRVGARKPLDPAMAERNQAGGAVLVGSDWPHFLSLDVTGLAAAGAAERIADWVRRIGPN